MDHGPGAHAGTGPLGALRRGPGVEPGPGHLAHGAKPPLDRPGAGVTIMAEREVADIGALSDLCTPWCLHVVVTLRIAEQIAAGVTDIDRLAAAASGDAEVLHSVLSHLVRKGVFEEPENTPLR